MMRSLFIEIGGWEMKTYKTVIALVISAIVTLSCGYRIQSSANETWQAVSAKLASNRNECINRAKTRALSEEGSMVLSGQRFAMEAEWCGMQQSMKETSAFDAYESRMNVAAALLVSGVMMFVGAFFSALAANDRKAQKALREKIVRLRVASFQRRARLAKRENAMRQLELARS